MNNTRTSVSTRAYQLDQKKYYQIYSIEEMFVLVNYNKEFAVSTQHNWQAFAAEIHQILLEALRRLNNERASLSHDDIQKLEELVKYADAIKSNTLDNLIVALKQKVQDNNIQSELLIVLQNPLAYINMLDEN